MLPGGFPQSVSQFVFLKSEKKSSHSHMTGFVSTACTSQQSASGLPLDTLYVMHERNFAPRLRHTMVVVPPQMADLVPTVIP